MLQIVLNPTVRLLFAAQVLSLVGTGIATFTLGLLAYDLAGAAAGQVLGTLLAVRMLAFVVISPFANVVLGSVPRRRCLVLLNLARALIIVALPFVTNLWQVGGLVFLQQACAATAAPMFQATVPDVLPNERQYTQALSVSRLVYELEAFISPAVAALLLTVIPFRFLFWGAALSFCGAAALLAVAAIPNAQPAAGVLRRLWRGFRVYGDTPALRGLLALNLAIATTGAMVLVNTVVYVRGLLAGSDQGVAWLLTAYGVGSLVVAVILPRLFDVVRDRTVMLTGAACAAVLLALASGQPSLKLALWVWLALGVSKALMVTPTGRILARATVAGDRPLIYAVHASLANLAWLVAYPIAGWGSSVWGLATTFEVMAALASVGAVVAFFVWPAQETIIVLESHHNSVPSSEPEIDESLATTLRD